MYKYKYKRCESSGTIITETVYIQVTSTRVFEWNCYFIRRSFIEMANHFFNGGKGKVNQFSTNVTVRELELCMRGRESNPGPPAFAAVALTTELWHHAQKHVNLG